MGKVYTSPKQASDFIDEYKWWIVGILFAIPLLFFGYYRIQTALLYAGDSFVSHYGKDRRIMDKYCIGETIFKEGI